MGGQFKYYPQKSTNIEWAIPISAHSSPMDFCPSSMASILRWLHDIEAFLVMIWLVVKPFLLRFGADVYSCYYTNLPSEYKYWVSNSNINPFIPKLWKKTHGGIRLYDIIIGYPVIFLWNRAKMVIMANLLSFPIISSFFVRTTNDSPERKTWRTQSMGKITRKQPIFAFLVLVNLCKLYGRGSCMVWRVLWIPFSILSCEKQNILKYWMYCAHWQLTLSTRLKIILYVASKYGIVFDV